MHPEQMEALRRAIRAEEDGSASLAAAPPMLDIRTLDKGWLALPYVSLRKVEFDPRAKPPLRITFSSYTLELEGRNLQALYRAVATHRLEQLREVGERHDTAGPDEPVVYKLTIVERKKKKPAKGSAAGNRSPG
ncbi:MAG: hypothetical protein EA423_09565 [Phycisphaerales bacterium]|nr:MAG: hypothetical protein EA423_09565 [Phycisphaerales bacterium]